MKNLKKILACATIVSMLCSVNVVNAMATEDTTSTENFSYSIVDGEYHAYYMDSDGNRIEITYFQGYVENLLGVEKDIVLNDGEVVTLPTWTFVLEDDERLYAYVVSEYDEQANVYKSTSYIDGERIDGFPRFDSNGDYIGASQTADIDESNSNWVLPDGTTIDKASATGVTYYTDENNNYDGYAISCNLYSMGYTSNEITLPNGDTIEKLGNVIIYRYNSNGEFVGYLFDSVSIPADDDIDSEGSITEFTVGDSVYPRGDINLDGKTNTADLLYLKKYLLGLIEW